MKIEVIGKIDRKYCEDAVNKARKLLMFRDGIDFYFLENNSYCRDIVHDFPRLRKFMNTCYFDSSSFTFKDKGVVVILHGREYLKSNKDAMIGLLLHEIVHAKQHRDWVYKDFLKLSQRSIQEHKKFIKNREKRSAITGLMSRISSILVLLLKDIYCNSELMRRGLWKYLLEFYYNDLAAGKKTCPRPVFYERFKAAARKDFSIIQSAFEFELALLSVYLPFRTSQREKAMQMIDKVKNCYELNIVEIARKCHELVVVYLNHFGEKGFDRMFFDTVNSKIINLLN